ncbi:MAG: DnaJ domain-containing protein [Pseudomonadota bacterium]
MAAVLLLPLPLGAGFFVAAILAARWFVNANPATLARTLRSGGSVGLILVGIVLILRGQVLLGGSLCLAGLGRLGFANGPSFRGSARGTPRAGGASTVRTARLEARLDHDTGEIDAEVLAGRHEGRHFSEMGDTEVLDVWADCKDDEESRLIVEAYLDRRHPQWRDDVDVDADFGGAGTGGTGSAGQGGTMTEEDAYEILGLAPGASEAEIRASHRRLMKQMHPDQGGSTFFAAKLNEAKDILLRRR